jgi:hydroxyethylthiazole kinase-like sugar kinase family protein
MTEQPLTKEELKAILDTQAKSTEQMVIIAGHLKTIVDQQKESCETTSSKIDAVKNDTNFIKIVFGSGALIALVAQLIIHMIGGK